MANKKVSQLTSKPSVLTTDLFPIADPSTGQLYKTTISDLGTAIGSGVSSVNSLVGAVVLDTDDIQELVSPTNKWFTDTRARAALSASSPLTYNSGTGVFGIQVATGSQNGYLSSADWTTFNAKQAALSGTGFVKSTGGTISYDTNTYLTTSSAASTYLALGGGTMTGVLFGASASFSGYVGFGGNTSPLYPVDVDGSGRFSGDLRIESTNPRIYLTDTDNNPDYFISNTDGTFTVYDVTNSTSRFTIGTTGNATFANAIIGGGSITGTALYSTGIVSVGTSLSVGTFVSAGGSLTGSALYVTGMTAGSGAIYHTGSRLTFANYNASGTLHFEVNGGVGALTLNADKSATFDGALSGTSASFSGNMTIGEDLTLANVGTAASNILASSTSGTLSLTAGASSGYTGGGTIELVANDRSGTNTRGEVYISAGNASANTANGFIALQTANTERLRVTYSGNVGIGTSSPNDYSIGSTAKVLQVTGSSYGIVNANAGSVYAWLIADTGAAATGTQSNHDFKIVTNNTERMRITSGGNVGIGTTSPSYKLSIVGDLRGYKLISSEAGVGAGNYTIFSNDDNVGYIDTIRAVNSGDFHFRFDGTSRANINRSTGAYTATSDLRLKTNILDSQSVLSVINQIKVRSYNWIENNSYEPYGLIAQELHEILPEYVYKPKKENESWGLSKAELVPMLVKAIQELKAELDKITGKV